MTTITALLTNTAYGYPTRGARRRRKPTILACLHQTKIPTVAAAVSSGVNMNEWVHESIECSGSGTEPYTDAQFESVAHLVAAASRALGIPINRSTVVVHADINGVSRRSDPWPPSIREARVKRVIDRANAILRPPIVTVSVKAGDSLSAIASAHGLTLEALLAFPENARYRANPGLIHPGDIVRVK